MQTIDSFEHLQSTVQAFSTQAGEPIAIHGTPRIVQVGDTLEPRVSTSPARDAHNTEVMWDSHEPYVFGAYPEYLDVATFFATVRGVVPPSSAPVWEDPSGRFPMCYMANDEAKETVMQLDPVGTFCAVPRKSFDPSPRGARFEVVSTRPVHIIGAWAVRHSALSFDVTTLPPPAILGIP